MDCIRLKSYNSCSNDIITRCSTRKHGRIEQKATSNKFRSIRIKFNSCGIRKTRSGVWCASIRSENLGCDSPKMRMTKNEMREFPEKVHAIICWKSDRYYLSMFQESNKYKQISNKYIYIFLHLFTYWAQTVKHEIIKNSSVVVVELEE